MPNVQVTSQRITGSSDAQTVAVQDDNRKYLAVIAQDSAVTLSLGDVDHSVDYFTLASGNMFETAVNNLSKMQYSGSSSYLTVIQDKGSKTVLTSDGAVLTYDGEVMTYQSGDGSRPSLLSAPVFS